MYYFYVLYSLKDGRLYKGISKDVAGRLLRHNAGSTPSTRYRRPLILIYAESFPNKQEALVRERWSKSLEGGSGLKMLLVEHQILDEHYRLKLGF